MLAPGEGRGSEFPRIPGPRSQDRVCIVGAGTSGVHMALRLKQKGYTRVTLLEKTFRSGGKCEDIRKGGVPNPMGASFAGASYFDNFIPLAREYGLGELIKLPTATVWATNSAADPGSNLTTSAFMLASLMKITNSSSPQVNLGTFFEVL